MDNLRGNSNLGAAIGATPKSNGYLDCFVPLHDQSTCEGSTKAMPTEMLHSDALQALPSGREVRCVLHSIGDPR